jgi:hypothetical protein
VAVSIIEELLEVWFLMALLGDDSQAIVWNLDQGISTDIFHRPFEGPPLCLVWITGLEGLAFAIGYSNGSVVLYRRKTPDVSFIAHFFDRITQPLFY